jgi:hypothetical protein
MLMLKDFRSGIQQLFKKAWKLYKSVTRKGRLFADKLPKSFQDNLLDCTSSYSFLQLHSIVLNYIVCTCNLASINDGEGHLSWYKAALHSLFSTLDVLNNALCVLTYILLSPSMRAEEFLNHKL